MMYCKFCKKVVTLQRTGNCDNDSCPFKAENDPTEREQDIPPNTPGNLGNLKVIKGDLLNTVKIAKRAQDLLVFSNAVLWPDRSFSETSRVFLNSLIAEHFKGSKDIDRSFCELVERTVLARRWADEKEYRFVLRPEWWFDINRIDGLYFTNRLYAKVLTQRNTIPTYEHGLSIISEAVLRYIDQRDVLDVRAYREKFIRMNRMDLLIYYYCTVVHIQFLNL